MERVSFVLSYLETEFDDSLVSLYHVDPGHPVQETTRHQFRNRSHLSSVSNRPSRRERPSEYTDTRPEPDDRQGVPSRVDPPPEGSLAPGLRGSTFGVGKGLDENPHYGRHIRHKTNNLRSVVHVGCTIPSYLQCVTLVPLGGCPTDGVGGFLSTDATKMSILLDAYVLKFFQLYTGLILCFLFILDIIFLCIKSYIYKTVPIRSSRLLP